jgi:predicted 3-demethylubiquinone-9 3-methyltransferase (glyoxalase superfamily)
MLKITPFLWFDRQAEQAARFYVSVFPDSRIEQVSRYTSAGPLPEGTAMVVDLVLQGQRLRFLNGGPDQKLSEAFSLMVECETQEEVDRYWNLLLADGGEENVCGWLKDRFGLSWQITPVQLGRMISDPDRERADQVMRAMFQMKKLDIKALEQAYAEVRSPA